MTNRDLSPSALPRRTFLGCAAAVSAAVAAGCSSSSRAAETAPFSVPATEVPLGGAAFFPEQATVITQPHRGEFHAFLTNCPHQGCAVTQIRDGLIRCPCHGSLFRLTDGSAERGPADQPLTRRTITREGSDILVT